MIKITTKQSVGEISSTREIEFDVFDEFMTYVCWESDLMVDAGGFFEDNMYEEPKTDDDSTKH